MSVFDNYRRARRSYMADPSRSHLRIFLRAKARVGRFDDRMLSARFTGNTRDLPTNVCPEAKRAIVRAVVAMLVPTDTLRAAGSSTSYHAQRNVVGEGLAVDIGNYPGYRPGEPGWPKGHERLVVFQRKELWRRRHGKIDGMVELIGPHNAWAVLRGRETDLVEGTMLENQHDDHLHEAFVR